VNRYSQRLDRRLRGSVGGLAFARRIFLPWLQILPPWALMMRSMWRSAPWMRNIARPLKRAMINFSTDDDGASAQPADLFDSRRG
jgi:hypothetical protein